MTIDEQLKEIRDAQIKSEERASADWNKHHALVSEDVASAQAERARCDVHRAFIRENALTLRDEFARAALPPVIAEAHRAGRAISWVAETAYYIADAMLAERAK